MTKAFKYLFITLSSLTLFQGNAHAYIDPGSGSFIMQMLLASLLGCLFFVKTIWARIKGFFSRKNDDGESPEK